MVHLDLQLYQQEHATNQPLVTLHEWRWWLESFLRGHCCAHCGDGITVVGIDAKSYLVNFASPQKPVTADDLTRDYDSIARIAIARPGIDYKAPVVLAGWSLGAGYSVNRGDATGVHVSRWSNTGDQSAYVW
jgi:hypothetical protein